MGDLADLARPDHFLDLGVDGVVAVVESADDLALGLRFGGQHLEGVFGVGGHGLFGNDVHVIAEAPDDVFHVEAVHADHQQRVGLGFLHHLVEVCGQIFGHVLGLGNLFLADLEPERVDVEHGDQFGAVLELTEHRTDVHVDGPGRHAADGVLLSFHSENSLVWCWGERVSIPII